MRILTGVFLFLFLSANAIGKTDTTQILQKQQAFNNLLGKDLAAAKKMQSEIFSESSELNFKTGLLLSELNAASIKMKESDYEQAYYLLSCFVKDHKKELKLSARAYRLLGDYYQDQAQLDSASVCFYKSLNKSSQLKDSLEIALSLERLGIFNSLYGDSTAALKFLNQAKNYFKNNSKPDYISSLMAIANHHFNVDNIQKSLESQRLILRELDSGATTIGDIYLNIGACFSELEELDSSAYYFALALPYFEAAGFKEDMALIHFNLGVVNLNAENYEEAKAHFEKSLNLSELVYPELHLANLQGISELNAAQEDFRAAYELLYQAYNLNDSIRSMDMQKAITEMNAKYESEKKDRAIETLELKSELQTKRQYLMLAVASLSILALFFAIVFVRNNRKKTIQLSIEKERSDHLLLNILPHEIAEELKQNGVAKAQRFEKVSVLFCDIKNFTQIGQTLSAEELVHELNHCFSAFDDILSKYKVEKIKTVGDAYICAGGIPREFNNSVEQTLSVAKEFQAFMKTYQAIRTSRNKPFFELRVGLHTGPVIAGIVGKKKFVYDIWGDTVNTAARMEQACEVGKINVSETTMEMSKDMFKFIAREPQEVKGKGMMNMYYLEQPT